jgi:hypothetical protein
MADLKRAYRELDPAQPARNVQQYVPRPGDPLGVLGEELRIRTSPIHVLVGGQRGVGKTTELLRLNDLLEVERLPHRMLIPDRVIGSQPAAFLWTLCHFMAQGYLPIVSELRTRVSALGAAAGAPEALAAKNLIKEVVEQVCSTSGHTFTYLLDGFEKFSPADAAIYAMAMVDVPCSFVIVVPISMLLSSEFASVIAEWDRPISIPAITLVDRDGNPYSEGLAVLRAVVERRAGTDAFERPALDLVIEASGGIHRELLTLAQQACLRASVAGCVQVREQDAQNAIEDRRQEVSFHLTPQDLDYLHEVHEHHRITANPLALPLIERNLIVGYHGGWSWFDVHPIVKPLLAAHRKGSAR